MIRTSRATVVAALGGVAILALVGLAAVAGVEPPRDDPAPATSHFKSVATARDSILVAIPGGLLRLGDDHAAADEAPSFGYRAKALLMDRTPVTVAQFRRFVAETGYVTEAERLGGAVLDNPVGAWRIEASANWRRPLGEDGPAARDDHPVTQVSWNDAAAFCGAYGARLPTEFEWEQAGRLGQTEDGHVFKAGDPIEKGGHFRANVWQGLFPLNDTGADGFKTVTSPVGAFGAAPSGLTDMAGNVWEWTASWYRPYATKDAGFAPRPGDERVQRGGSFLCDPSFCQGFRVTARGHATPDSALMHVGFRCVVDPQRVTARAGRLAALS